MAVKIRLTRLGKRHDPKYRLVAVEEGKKRDGRYIEKIGFYDPMKQPHILVVNEEKLKSWLAKGAQLSEGARKLISRKLICS